MGRSLDGPDAYDVIPSPFHNYFPYELPLEDELPEHLAKVDSFALDTFEVTVGRFSEYLKSYSGAPQEGAGAHPVNPGSGWKESWSKYLPTSKDQYTTALEEYSKIWDGSSEKSLNKPIWLSWYGAFAFCIWDGGRLPTELEWEYAATGGDQNRLYPWGWTDSPEGDLVQWPYDITKFFQIFDIKNVGGRPAGRGRWGHYDLSGGFMEWVADQYDASFYKMHEDNLSCSNCMYQGDSEPESLRVIRGYYLRSAARHSNIPTDGGPGYISYTKDKTKHYTFSGVRCARDL